MIQFSLCGCAVFYLPAFCLLLSAFCLLPSAFLIRANPR